jgi:hypothetical protein
MCEIRDGFPHFPNNANFSALKISCLTEKISAPDSTTIPRAMSEQADALPRDANSRKALSTIVSLISSM